ncbi:Protein FAR-RED IMPAIRED RESPONSE 1 [Bienertia sinuspersici]
MKRWQYWHCECGPRTSTNQVVNEGDPKGAETGIAGYLNKDGLWELHKMELTHKNHVPTPSKSRFIPSYRDVPKFLLRVVKDLMDTGVKQSQIYHALANQMNGFENLHFLVKDMNNVVGKERSKEFDEFDCCAMFEYFAKTKEANDNFFFSWKVDKANKLMDVVWFDARSRVAYMDFFDVVCFDATNITNHYEISFANFVGVNHHGQTIHLGCALVRNEDTETYKWIMREWLECMGGVQPDGIITDQSVPMAKAIQEQGAEEATSCEKVGEFHKKMKDVVYDSLSIKEFESRWIELIWSFKLEGNEWLKSIWEDRSRWVPAYVKDTFWAAYVVRNVNHSKGRKHSSHFQRIYEFQDLFERFRSEIHELFNFVLMRRRLPQQMTIEGRRRLNQPLWWRDATFKDVQSECLALIYVLPGTKVQILETVTEYTLIQRIQVGDPIRHVTHGLKVTMDMENLEFSCSCRMFKHKGILCRHCIRAMEMTKIQTVLDKYVLNRWRKDVKRKHLDVKVAFHAPDKTEDEQRYRWLQYEYEKKFNLTSTSNEVCEYAVKNAQTFFEELEQV